MRYTVTSEDKNWHRTYAINIHYTETKSIPTVFNFENVKTVPYNKNEYSVLYEAASGYPTLTWSSGNQWFALTGSGYAPNDFPTSISPNGRTGNCLQLITDVYKRQMFSTPFIWSSNGAMTEFNTAVEFAPV